MKRVSTTIAICILVFVFILTFLPGFYTIKKYIPETWENSNVDFNELGFDNLGEESVGMLGVYDGIAGFVSIVVYFFAAVSFPMLIVKLILNRNNVLDKIFTIIPFMFFFAVFGHGIYTKNCAIIYAHWDWSLSIPQTEWELGAIYYIACILSIIACMFLIFSMVFEGNEAIHIRENKDKWSQIDTNELKKFKELFEMGIISRQEFDAKKKEILRL